MRRRVLNYGDDLSPPVLGTARFARTFALLPRYRIPHPLPYLAISPSRRPCAGTLLTHPTPPFSHPVARLPSASPPVLHTT